MRQTLERTFFPYVIKPGRYAGGEVGEIKKDHAGRLTYLHAYPDKYEVGQTALSVQSFYHIINQDERFVCERIFAPAIDAEEVLRRQRLPLFSIESSLPIREFDVIGFTLVDTSVFTNVLTMLELGGLPLRASERTDAMPLIIGGGPAALNPEPMAEYFDAFFIGEADEGIIEMLALIHHSKGLGRRELLTRLVKYVPSVYVPSFYNENGESITSFAPPNITARVVSELKPSYFSIEPLLPLVETLSDSLPVEIYRGSSAGCEQCQTLSLSTPGRFRTEPDMSEQVTKQLRSTGYSQVALLTPPETAGTEFELVMTSLAKNLAAQEIGIHLPALIPGTVSESAFEALARVKQSGFTIAPEAGTERLRQFMGRHVTDAAIYETIKIALDKEWQHFKMIFVLGLPTETQVDLDGIAKISRNVLTMLRARSARNTLSIVFVPFCPKPHTPLQWDTMPSESALQEKLVYIKKQSGHGNIQFKLLPTAQRVITTALSRGGRELSAVIEAAWKLGCRFDGWDEHFDFEKWLKAFESAGTSINTYVSAFSMSGRLPWSHIQSSHGCEELRSLRMKMPGESESAVTEALLPSTIDSIERSEFGRAKKRVVKLALTPARNRIRMRWGKSVRFRYMSHLDNVKLFQRLFRRAGLPVSYSQDKTQSLDVSFGPPLPLGYTSEAEFFDVTLGTHVTNTIIDDFRKTLPDGICVYQTQLAPARRASLNSVLNRVEYTVPLDEWEDRSELQRTIHTLLRAEVLAIERLHKGVQTTVNVRPAIYHLSLEGPVLVMLLGLGDGGYVRPFDVLTLLQAGLKYHVNSVPVHRRALYRIDSDGSRIDPMEL